MRIIHPSDDGYPVGLRDLEDAPPIHVIGHLRPASGIAVVGTRRCTRYGTGLANGFGSAIAEAGWTTVSGLARGIDGHAHIGCLGSGGHAVAVLGCGADVCYPIQHRDLYERILQKEGAVISEYPPGTPPDRWRFPARNRLIAAISVAVVVVEAAERGGALITARLAAEIGRPVFVVPGDVDRPASAGCNRLLKDGAHPVLGPADLIDELTVLIGPPPGQGRAREPVTRDFPPSGICVEDLSTHWGTSTSETLARLGRMEVEGSVRRDGDLFYPG